MFQPAEDFQEENLIHEDSVKDRLYELGNLVKSTNFEKQKSRLQVESELCLHNL